MLSEKQINRHYMPAALCRWRVAKPHGPLGLEQLAGSRISRQSSAWVWRPGRASTDCP